MVYLFRPKFKFKGLINLTVENIIYGGKLNFSDFFKKFEWEVRILVKNKFWVEKDGRK